MSQCRSLRIRSRKSSESFRKSASKGLILRLRTRSRISSSRRPRANLLESNKETTQAQMQVCTVEHIGGFCASGTRTSCGSGRGDTTRKGPCEDCRANVPSRKKDIVEVEQSVPYGTQGQLDDTIKLIPQEHVVKRRYLRRSASQRASWSRSSRSFFSNDGGRPLALSM